MDNFGLPMPQPRSCGATAESRVILINSMLSFVIGEAVDGLYIRKNKVPQHYKCSGADGIPLQLPNPYLPNHSITPYNQKKSKIKESHF